MSVVGMYYLRRFSVFQCSRHIPAYWVISEIPTSYINRGIIFKSHPAYEAGPRLSASAARAESAPCGDVDHLVSMRARTNYKPIATTTNLITQRHTRTCLCLIYYELKMLPL